MSYTGTEIFGQSIAVIDELSDTGQVVDSQIAEYKYRTPFLLDMWQKEMAKSGDLFKTYEISCTRKNNLLTDVNQFCIVEHTDTDQDYAAYGAWCFYFEIDSDARILMNDTSGNFVSGTYTFNGVTTTFNGILDLTVPVGTTSFVSCNGMFDTKSNVVMTFSGNYYYRHNNRALSNNRYSSIDKVPDFKPWYKVTMPPNFKSKTQVINEYTNWQYEMDTVRKWEGNNELLVNFAYEGIIRIKYIPVPVKITSLSQTIEVDDVCAISGAYYLAEHFAISDQNDDLAKKCRDKFKELKVESMIKTPLSPQEIKDVYSISDIK